jgi:hypothetical protein
MADITIQSPVLAIVDQQADAAYKAWLEATTAYEAIKNISTECDAEAAFIAAAAAVEAALTRREAVRKLLRDMKAIGWK